MKFLFIGGAPRSGTTLLSQLMDSHPNMAVFPFEHSVFDNYYLKKQNKTFFENDFIINPQNGQQAILSSFKNLNDYSEKLKKEYNKEYNLKVNPEEYLLTYQNSLKQDFNLKSIFKSLTLASISSNTYLKNKNVEVGVHKRPYYTLLYADKIIEEIPDAKILIIQRNPISRYTSAKMRRLSLKKQNFRINRVNCVQAHTEVDASVDELIKKHCQTLSPINFKVIKYENMMTETEMVFKEIFEWLDIKFDKSFECPTRFGEPAEAGSKLITKKGLDKSSINRDKQYLELTNEHERVVHSYYLYKSTLIDHGPSFISFSFAYFHKFKFETQKQYWFKIITYPFNFTITKRKIRNRLSEIILNKKGSISGAL